MSDINSLLKTSEVVKTFVATVFAIVTVVIGCIFWIQAEGQEKYYPKLSGQHLESQMTRIEQRTDIIANQNIEIIRALGHLEEKSK